MIQEHIAVLQSTLRPAASKGVKTELFIIFGLFILSAVLHAASLMLKYALYDVSIASVVSDVPADCGKSAL